MVTSKQSKWILVVVKVECSETHNAGAGFFNNVWMFIGLFICGLIWSSSPGMHPLNATYVIHKSILNRYRLIDSFRIIRLQKNDISRTFAVSTKKCNELLQETLNAVFEGSMGFTCSSSTLALFAIYWFQYVESYVP